MGRIESPRNARSERTRAALLDAAWRLIEAEGATAVTMERIAEEAGTSRRSLYLHFASRADLLIAVREHVDAAFDVEASVRPIAEATTPGAALDAWARHVARYHARIAPLVRATDQARRSDPDAQVAWDEAMGRWYAGCRGGAEGLAAAGQLAPPWTPETAADLLWALMSVELLEDLVDDRGWSVEAYAERLALVARRSLMVDPTAA